VPKTDTWTVLQELIKWQADIEAADKMYKDGQVALEKVALLQTQVDEAALREIQVKVFGSTDSKLREVGQLIKERKRPLKTRRCLGDS
jgi:hypothetical protein